MWDMRNVKLNVTGKFLRTQSQGSFYLSKTLKWALIDILEIFQIACQLKNSMRYQADLTFLIEMVLYKPDFYSIEAGVWPVGSMKKLFYFLTFVTVTATKSSYNFHPIYPGHDENRDHRTRFDKYHIWNMRCIKL